MLAHKACPSADRYQLWCMVELAGWGQVSILEGSSLHVVELAYGRVDWHSPDLQTLCYFDIVKYSIRVQALSGWVAAHSCCVMIEPGTNVNLASGVPVCLV